MVKDSRIKYGNDNFFYTPAVHCRVKPTNDSSFFFYTIKPSPDWKGGGASHRNGVRRLER